jgi:hypothetical protein
MTALLVLPEQMLVALTIIDKMTNPFKALCRFWWASIDGRNRLCNAVIEGRYA